MEGERARGGGKHGGRIWWRGVGGDWGGKGESKDPTKKKKNYLLYKLLNLISKSIFTLRRDGKVEFLLSDRFDIVVEVNKVCGGLKVDFAMVGVHYYLLLFFF